MRRVEVSNKASKVDGIHTKSYCVKDWLAGGEGRTVVQPSPPANQPYTQYDLVWMPSTLDALLDTSTRLMSLTRGCFYSF